jgi:predicted signal transduction protein with EAL and GGDEF domain
VPSFATPAAPRPSGKAEARLRRLAVTGYWFFVLAGGVLTVAALPSAIAAMASAPAQLWVEGTFACLVDLRPIRLPAAMRSWATFVVSVCFCFPIMLLFGLAPAIVIQVLAVTLASRALRLNPAAAAFLAARLVCSFTVAAGAAELAGVTAADFRVPLTAPAAGGILLMIVAFVAVSSGINFGQALASGATRGEIAVQLRFEVLARGSAVVLGTVIATIPSVWSVSLVIVPLLGWSQLSRALADQDTRLEHDQVTGLLSRYGLYMAMHNLPRPHRRAPDEFALIVIQLRSIGYIGRAFGRGAVDHVLQAAAGRLLAATGPGELTGRVSDNQLVVIRPHQPGESAEDAARRMVGELTAPVDVIEGVPLRLEPLAGVAPASQGGQHLADLALQAEAALFEAAARQAAAAVYSPEKRSAVDERLALLRRFSGAVRDPARASEITLLYQPQVSMRTGQVGAVEALLRWTDPERGPVPTDELIRAVEPTGLMQQLTVLVLDRAASQLAEWNRSGIRLRGSVNVSVWDLVTEGFDAEVRDVLARHKLSPGQLDIEVTERAMVENSSVLEEAAKRIAQLGVGLSLDDFGTGFSSLRQLRRLPLTEVKIDRAYVSKIVDSATDRAMVRAMYELARALGLRTVAEGIEDEATAGLLAGLDGIIGQGWYYARPMPAPDLVEWLRRSVVPTPRRGL